MLLRFLDIKDPEERQEAIRKIFFFTLLVLVFVGVAVYMGYKNIGSPAPEQVTTEGAIPAVYRVNEKGELEAVPEEEARGVMVARQTSETGEVASFLKNALDFFGFGGETPTQEKKIDIPPPPIPEEVLEAWERARAEKIIPLPPVPVSDDEVYIVTKEGLRPEDIPYLIGEKRGLEIQKRLEEIRIYHETKKSQ